MAFFTAAGESCFQHQPQSALAQHVSGQALPQGALFAEDFFGIQIFTRWIRIYVVHTKSSRQLMSGPSLGY